MSSREDRPLIVVHFASLKDPRKHLYKVDYPLSLILLTVVAAVLCGYTTWDEFAGFAEERADWLRALVPYDAPETPSADTLRRVFERLDPTAFTRCFTDWTRALAAGITGPIVATDGKSVAGARDAAAPSVPLHLLHVFLTGEQLLLAAVPVAGAPGEPVALRDVLATLELRGGVVTGDAQQCNGAMTEVVRDRGADYVLALKANRGPQHDEVAAFFAPRVTLDGALRDVPAGVTVDHVVTGERGHGRREFRQAWAVDAAACPRTAAHFRDVCTVLCIERARLTGEAVEDERHYYISSLRPDAALLAGLVRGQWSIENHLHHALDVVLHEDATRIRKGPAAENLAIVRRLALTLLKRDTSTTLSLPKRMQRATLNDDYRRHLLSLAMT